MSHNLLKQDVIAKQIQTELETKSILVQDCNRKYEGEVKGVGDTVTIIGAGTVPVTVTHDGTEPTFGNPVAPVETSQKLTINETASMEFILTDIDRALGAGKAFDVYKKQIVHTLSNQQDIFVGSLAKSADAVKLNTTAPQLTKDNVLGLLDMAQMKLWENNVPSNTELVCNVSPQFYKILSQQLALIDTNNSTMLEKGVLGKYSNMSIKMSNNIAKDGVEDLIMLRTKEAISFVNPLTKLKALDGVTHMGDWIQALTIFGGKITKPKELMVVNVKY